MGRSFRRYFRCKTSDLYAAMSTPAGQSELQALHDRHRSSDSATSRELQPPETTSPFAISCSTRARPRVESFSSRVAKYDGHMNPPESEESARHFPTPTQRWIARVKSSPSAKNASPSVRRSFAAA